MKKNVFLRKAMSLILMTMMVICANAKINMGTINLTVGESKQVFAEPSTYYTVSGNWSRTGSTAFYISARSQRSCTITAINAGTATLEWEGFINATWAEMYWSVNVSPAPVLISKIELNKNQLTLKVNEQECLIETVYPSNATNKSVSWSSSNSAVAEVNNEGLVVAKKVGSATITCKTNDGSGKYATCNVTINPEEISTTIVNAIAGYNYSMIIDKNGALWACGDNSSGELGDETREDKPLPTKVMNNVSDVAAGWSHTLILKNDASLWGCGQSLDGQLGVDTQYVLGNDPEKIMDNVSTMAAGHDFSYVVKKDGSLWTCGWNRYGQLGDGTTANRKYFVKIMENVKSVAVGEFHALILKTDGSLWACGRNYNGQLGDGTNDDKNYPVKVAEDVAFIAAGSDHSMIIKSDKSLWTCGLNGNGQLGTGGRPFSSSSFIKIMENVAYVGCSKSSVTQIIKKDGSYWACGYNGDDNLGGGNTSGGIVSPFKILDGVSTVSSGSSFTLLVKTDGSLWVCGENKKGQLGNGTTTDVHTLLQIVEGDGQTQGIESVSVSNRSVKRIYSLSGQLLTTPKKGINIIGGKKVVVK